MTEGLSSTPGPAALRLSPLGGPRILDGRIFISLNDKSVGRGEELAKAVLVRTLLPLMAFSEPRCRRTLQHHFRLHRLQENSGRARL